MWKEEAFHSALRLFDRINAVDRYDEKLFAAVQASIIRLQCMLKLYGCEGSIISFNGGKDAAVSCDLYIAVLADYYRTASVEPEQRQRPRAVFFQEGGEFPDQVIFTKNRAEELDLKLAVLQGSYADLMKSYVAELLSTEEINVNEWQKHPAFIIGVRQTDPFVEEHGYFQPCSKWIDVPFMRVHPILDWPYGLVWKFIEEFGRPFCPLYKQGFSSLGKMNETQQNPNLLLDDGRCSPASALSDWTTERCGRTEN